MTVHNSKNRERYEWLPLELIGAGAWSQGNDIHGAHKKDKITV